MAQVLDARVVEIGQIAPVIDDSLRVGVREAHARERGVLERRLAVGRLSEIHRRHRNRGLGCAFSDNLKGFCRFCTGKTTGERSHEALDGFGLRSSRVTRLELYGSRGGCEEQGLARFLPRDSFEQGLPPHAGQAARRRGFEDDGEGRAARSRPDQGTGACAPREGHLRASVAELEGPDRASGSRGPDGEWLQRLARLRRPGRLPGIHVRPREEKPSAPEARGHRPYRQGSGDHRAEDDAGREGRPRRVPSGSALQLDAACARVDRRPR